VLDTYLSTSERRDRRVPPENQLHRRKTPLKSARRIFDPVFPVLTLFGGFLTLKNPRTGSKAENKPQKSTD
jgi:hypothetical protein